MTSDTAQNPRGGRSTNGAETQAGQALDAWYAAWNAHDPGKILALTTPDISYEDPMAPQSMLRGQAQVEGYLQAAMRAVPDLHIQMLEKWTSPGGQVIASFFHLGAALVE